MNTHGLFVVPQRDPLEAAIDSYLSEDVTEFTFHVAVARAMLRDFPELVQAKRFPGHLRAAYGGDPDKLRIEDPFRPGSREVARKRLKGVTRRA